MNKERLLKLAEHLESGKLGHEKFNFSIFHFVKVSGKTCGCALGELPYLFPDEWEFSSKTANPCLKMITNIYTGTFDGAALFFDITGKESRGLFSSYGSMVYPFMKELGIMASAKEVAQNIRGFVSYKESSI